MTASITVAQRFNGPPDSGQGGYSAGLLAAFLDGPAAVSLRRPVPLDSALAVTVADGSATLVSGQALVADATAEPFALDVPDPVDPAAAHDAATRYRGEREGFFSRCFVCGLARDDGFHVHAGEVAGRPLLASPWTPPDWAADTDGAVRHEFVWAALDCPASFATLLTAGSAMGMLARFAVRIDAPVQAGVEHVIVGWPIGAEGRKRFAGSAVFTADGALLAAGSALLVVPRE